MPLRIDTGRLSDLARRRGEYGAQAEAQRWASLGQGVGGTLGAYQQAVADESEERRRQNQDKYYETMRRQTEQRINAEERESTVANIVLQARRENGDDPVALQKWAMGDDRQADESEAMFGVINKLEDERVSGIERQGKEKLAQASLMARVTQKLDLWTGAGMPGAPTDAAGYLLERDDLVEGAIGVGITPARAAELFPEDFNPEQLRATANISRSLVDRIAMAALIEQDRLAAAGATLPDDAVERKTQMDAHERVLLNELALHMESMDQEALDRIFAEANGLAGSPRRVPVEVMEGFKDLKTFSPDWAERLRGRIERITPQEALTIEQEFTKAIREGRYEDAARWAKARAQLYGSSGGGQGGGQGDGAEGPIPTESLSSLEGEKAAIEARVWPSDSEPAPWRRNEEGQWERLSFEGDKYVYDPNNPSPPENERWLTEEQAQQEVNASEDAFRSEHNYPTRKEEERLFRSVEEWLSEELPKTEEGREEALALFEGVDWEGKKDWVSFMKDERPAEDAIWTGAPPRRHVPRDVLREFLTELFRDDRSKAEKLFPVPSRREVVESLETFRNWP